MTAVPDPSWPIVLLAAIQAIDGVLCLRPAAFVARCLTNVRFPRRFWVVLGPLKFAAVLGLLGGIWVPYLALVTTGALLAYFLVAVSMHVAAGDLGRDLFVNATGMLVICAATLAYCFLL